MKDEKKIDKKLIENLIQTGLNVKAATIEYVEWVNDTAIFAENIGNVILESDCRQAHISSANPDMCEDNRIKIVGMLKSLGKM